MTSQLLLGLIRKHFPNSEVWGLHIVLCSLMNMSHHFFSNDLIDKYNIAKDIILAFFSIFKNLDLLLLIWLVTTFLLPGFE